MLQLIDRMIEINKTSLQNYKKNQDKLFRSKLKFHWQKSRIKSVPIFKSDFFSARQCIGRVSMGVDFNKLVSNWSKLEIITVTFDSLFVSFHYWHVQWRLSISLNESMTFLWTTLSAAFSQPRHLMTFSDNKNLKSRFHLHSKKEVLYEFSDLWWHHQFYK